MGRRRTPPAGPSGSGGSLRAAVVDAELDLHGLTAAEAAVQLESFLKGWSQRRPGAVLSVITGRGNRSPEGPVLQPLVRELLKGPLAPLVAEYAAEPGGGAYRVRVSGAT